jgi:hypothetical protein
MPGIGSDGGIAIDRLIGLSAKAMVDLIEAAAVHTERASQSNPSNHF